MKTRLSCLALPLALVLALAGAACGGGEDDASTTASEPAAATDDSAATDGSGSAGPGPSTDSVAAAPGGSGPAGASATTQTAPVELVEWELVAETTYEAGTIEFTATNGGRFPHEFVVIRGTYADLAKSAIGAVLEDQLPVGALLGRTEKIQPGQSATRGFDLTAGDYVLLCNIAVGPNSHAGKGQVLDVTVT